MLNNRLALRTTDADAANLTAIADAMRGSGRGAFVSMTDTIRTALVVAAHLAREGVLNEVVGAAKGR